MPYFLIGFIVVVWVLIVANFINFIRQQEKRRKEIIEEIIMQKYLPPAERCPLHNWERDSTDRTFCKWCGKRPGGLDESN